MKPTRPSEPDKTQPSSPGDPRRPPLVQDNSDQGREWMEKVTDPLARLGSQ